MVTVNLARSTCSADCCASIPLYWEKILTTSLIITDCLFDHQQFTSFRFSLSSLLLGDGCRLHQVPEHLPKKVVWRWLVWIFAGWMPFLSHNCQCEDTEESMIIWWMSRMLERGWMCVGLCRWCNELYRRWCSWRQQWLCCRCWSNGWCRSNAAVWCQWWCWTLGIIEPRHGLISNTFLLGLADIFVLLKYTMSQKVDQYYFCDNFHKSGPVIIIFQC